MKKAMMVDEQPSLNQDRGSSRAQETPEPPQIKEQEEPCSIGELELKQEPVHLKLHSADGQNNRIGDIVVDWPPGESSGDCGLPVIVSVLSEANVDVSLYPGDSQSPVQNNSKCKSSNSMGRKRKGPSNSSETVKEGNLSVTDPKFQKRLDIHIEKYLCNTCELKFSSRGALLQYMQKHSGNRPFVCPICSKSYRSKHNLKVHERAHTCEKPYVCQKCDKAFVCYKMLKKKKTYEMAQQ